MQYTVIITCSTCKRKFGPFNGDTAWSPPQITELVLAHRLGCPGYTAHSSLSEPRS